MVRLTRKRIILIFIGLLILAVVVYGFLPDPIAVETATVERGALQVVVEEEGETRVERVYEISSPVAAFARRIDLEPGDPVQAGEAVVELEAPRAPIMDVRSRAEAVARVQSAEAGVAQAEEQRRAAAAAAQRTGEELARVQRLAEEGSATRQTLEQTVAEAEQASANVDAAEAGVAAARAELAAAQAALQYDSSGNQNRPVTDVLRSPVTGRVLTVHRRSEGQVNPAEPILEVGDIDNMEVRVEVLSQDATRIEPGTRVMIDEWGGDYVLEAVVDRVEPQGFTDVSSLGVEEMRVGVIADLASSPELWAGLGAGYRVLARFVVWEGDNVLIVPTSALFRTEDGWAAFAVEGGQAVRKQVQVDNQSGLSAQVILGLEEGELVIIHPSNEIEDGVRVEPRESD